MGLKPLPKQKGLDLTRMKGKDALEIAKALPGDSYARLVNAAGLILPTKSHSQAIPSRQGMEVVLALIAWLDAEWPSWRTRAWIAPYRRKAE